jgi:hypothetical protein
LQLDVERRTQLLVFASGMVRELADAEVPSTQGRPTSVPNAPLAAIGNDTVEAHSVGRDVQLAPADAVAVPAPIGLAIDPESWHG